MFKFWRRRASYWLQGHVDFSLQPMPGGACVHLRLCVLPIYGTNIELECPIAQHISNPCFPASLGLSRLLTAVHWSMSTVQFKMPSTWMPFPRRPAFSTHGNCELVRSFCGNSGLTNDFFYWFLLSRNCLEMIWLISHVWLNMWRYRSMCLPPSVIYECCFKAVCRAMIVLHVLCVKAVTALNDVREWCWFIFVHPKGIVAGRP